MVKHTYLAGILIAFLGLVTLIGPATSNAATTVTVSTCTDAAFNNALAEIMDEGGTINFTCSGTIALNSQKRFDGRGNNYTINGNGQVTLDGQNAHRIFLVPPGHNNSLTLRGLTLTRGRATEAADSNIPNGGQGGAIFFHYGNRRLEIYDSTFTSNVAAGNSTWDGGGVLHIRNADWLHVENSTFSNNQALNGGVMNILITPGYLTDNQYIDNTSTSTQHGGGGAIYIDNGSLTFANSLFQGNTTGYLGGGYFNAGGSKNIAGETLINNYFVDNGAGTQGGGVYTVDDRITVTGTTFANNVSVSNGGGLVHESKNNGSFTASITNSTFTGNLSGTGRFENPDPNATQGNGGAIVNSGAATMRITHTTIADNRTGVQGGAIRTGSGAVIVTASIITNNTSTFQWVNEQCHGDVRDGGGNIQYPAKDSVWDRDARCFNRSANADPELLALADNGGLWPTRAIPTNSSAVDHAGCVGVIADQREMLRPQGQRCDAGAVEIRTGTPPSNPLLSGSLTTGPVKPVFQWDHNAAGEWYQIILFSEQNGTIFKIWRQVANTSLCSAGTCTLNEPALYKDWGLLSGDYTWWVQAYSVANGFVATDAQTFSINIPRPGLVSGALPAEQDSDADGNVAFSWDEDDNALWYNIVITGPRNYSVNKWHLAADVCNAGTCTLPNRELGNGAYEWYQRAWGPGGMGAWTDAIAFYAGPPPPAEVVRTSPTGTIDVPSVTFEWDDAANAQWYRVFVTGPRGPYNKWFAAQDTTFKGVDYTGVCEAGTCRVSALDTGWWLTNGDYNWWVVGWSPGGLGPWQSEGQSFTLAASATNVVAMESPLSDGVVGAGNVTFTWQEDPAAAWYQVFIQTSGTPIKRWFEAGAACDSGTCTGEINLGAGTYTWYMRAWAPAGMTPYNAGRDFTAQ